MQYDIAIIGAGPAGAVLAAELKESFRVLLIIIVSKTTFPKKPTAVSML